MITELCSINKSERDLRKSILILKDYLVSNKEELYSCFSQNIRGKRNVHLHYRIDSKYVLLTTYFCTKQNPQHPQLKTPSDCIKYIYPWYNSVKKLGLTGIIFYDELTDEFVSKYQTDSIHFVRCTLGELSLNDERFLIYYLYLIENFHEAIFMTDGNDVSVNMSPFQMVDSDKPKLFVGRDNVNKIRQSAWMCEALVKFKKSTRLKVNKRYFDQPVYNAGIIGGNYLSVVFTLFHIVDLLVTSNSQENHNMTALNCTINKYWLPKTNNIVYRLFARIFSRNVYVDPDADIISKSDFIESGFPLNSAFRMFERSSKAYFTHK